MATKVNPETPTAVGAEKHIVENHPQHGIDPEKVEADQASSSVSNGEKGIQNPNWIPQNDDEYSVTFKTWIVVAILSWSYGVSFWIVPSLSACGAVVATLLGDPTRA